MIDQFEIGKTYCLKSAPSLEQWQKDWAPDPLCGGSEDGWNPYQHPIVGINLECIAVEPTRKWAKLHPGQETWISAKWDVIEVDVIVVDDLVIEICATPGCGQPRRVGSDLCCSCWKLFKGTIPLKGDPKQTEDIRPNYYKVEVRHKGGGSFVEIECFDLIDALNLNFYLANVLKYLFRAGRKTTDPTEDLRKVSTYAKQALDRNKQSN